MSSTLENGILRLNFDRKAGGLAAFTNRLTGESCSVREDGFVVETTAWRRTQQEMRQVEWTMTAEGVQARYADADLSVEVSYELRPADQFFQKRLAVTFVADASVTQITVSRSTLSLAGMQIVCVRHPDFDWISEYFTAKHGGRVSRPADSEPSRTFFGRTDTGGFFAGLGMPYDNSRMEQGTLNLGYAPNLKIKAGERLACEPMYFGVYRRSARDARAADWKPADAAVLIGKRAATPADPVTAAGKPAPLPAESAAMTAMTSAILGPPRHGVMAFACGWHCEMEQADYDTDAKLEGELRSLEFLASCGLDGLSDSHPWGGEAAKMAALREGERFAPSDRKRRFLERARELGLKVTQWPTMNNTHPWRPYGKPFRLDKPEWLRGLDAEPLSDGASAGFRRRVANCLACEPFYDWLESVIVEQALGTGLYESWCMDGDFWGTDAYFTTILPVTCTAANHEHLPGDANYACQRRLARLFAKVRGRQPGIYIPMCRPACDLGVWALRNVDSCFTLIESGTSGSNVVAGDEIRNASRLRVHHQFFPHWLDSALLFPSYADPNNVPAWPRGHLDYILLSALSSTPNLMFYLPSKTGIPEEDKAEIRKWLAWGRANARYLMVRHDLFDWPGKGVVDGSAHLIDGEGVIFLFNGTKEEKSTEFALTTESTGSMGTAVVQIHQEHPAAARWETCRPGAAVRWPVPAECVVVLRVTRK